jgi:hypothetical protein
MQVLGCSELVKLLVSEHTHDVTSVTSSNQRLFGVGPWRADTSSFEVEQGRQEHPSPECAPHWLAKHDGDIASESRSSGMHASEKAGRIRRCGLPVSAWINLTSEFDVHAAGCSAVSAVSRLLQVCRAVGAEQRLRVRHNFSCRAGLLADCQWI